MEGFVVVSNISIRRLQMEIYPLLHHFGDYYEASNEFDKDGSGSIFTSESEQVMKSLGENPIGMKVEVIAEVDTLHQ